MYTTWYCVEGKSMKKEAFLAQWEIVDSVHCSHFGKMGLDGAAKNILTGELSYFYSWQEDVFGRYI